MSLEQALAANTAALEANTAALLKTAGSAPAKTADAPKAEAPKEPAPPKTEAKPAETKAKKPTIEDARAALKAYQAIEGREAAIAIIKELGADTLGDLDPDKYQAAIDATKK